MDIDEMDLDENRSKDESQRHYSILKTTRTWSYSTRVKGARRHLCDSAHSAHGINYSYRT